ncbi:MAG: 6-pyruvoyl trahydropterin synthase family protein [Chloroflexota bacterium]
MYTVAVRRDFIAQHYLIGGDWGAENERHSHHYVLEVSLEGATLGGHGYLVDIVDIEAQVESLRARYKDHTLNELPEFEGTNPSLELFARILCDSLTERIRAVNLGAVNVKLWENELAWAGFRREL